MTNRNLIGSGRLLIGSNRKRKNSCLLNDPIVMKREQGCPHRLDIFMERKQNTLEMWQKVTRRHFNNFCREGVSGHEHYRNLPFGVVPVKIMSGLLLLKNLVTFWILCHILEFRVFVEKNGEKNCTASILDEYIRLMISLDFGICITTKEMPPQHPTLSLKHWIESNNQNSYFLNYKVCLFIYKVFGASWTPNGRSQYLGTGVHSNFPGSGVPSMKSKLYFLHWLSTWSFKNLSTSNVLHWVHSGKRTHLMVFFCLRIFAPLVETRFSWAMRGVGEFCCMCEFSYVEIDWWQTNQNFAFMTGSGTFHKINTPIGWK